MTAETSSPETETLGDFLRKTRLDSGLDIEQVSSETKIPLPTLRAMESDDHDALPAPAFARGFYNLYAKTLGIKPEELAKRYPNSPNHPLNDAPAYHPQHLVSEATNLAARPSVPVFSLFGTMLVLLLIAFAVLCWFFSWNPAEYLSKKLRNLDTGISIQQTKQSLIHEEVIEEEPVADKPAIVDPVTVTDEPNNQEPQVSDEIITAIQVPVIDQTEDQPPVQTGYTLQGNFTVQTTVTVTLDGGLPKKFKIEPGQTKTWSAAQSLTINLPSTNGVSLMLNDDIPITLPTGKPAIISIPEYFFD